MFRLLVELASVLALVLFIAIAGAVAALAVLRWIL